MPVLAPRHVGAAIDEVAQSGLVASIRGVGPRPVCSPSRSEGALYHEFETVCMSGISAHETDWLS